MDIDLVTFHLLALLFSAIAIVIADHDGYRYMRGKVEVLPRARVLKLHRAVTVGLAAMLFTGGLMVYDAPVYISLQAFWVKMLFVAALIINAVFISRMSKVASERSFVSLSERERTRLYLVGMMSTVSWLSAAAIGYFYL